MKSDTWTTDGEVPLSGERISSLVDLHAAIGERNLIVVEFGKHSMVEVSVNDRHVMTGNVWDFYPGCHGGWFYELAAKRGDFRTPLALADAIAGEMRDYAERNGLEALVTIASR